MWQKAEKYLSKDKLLAPLIKKYGPCRIRASSPDRYFIDLVESIVSQQLSGKAAETIFKRFERGLGGITVKKLLRARPEKLREFGLSKQKIGYLKDLADKIKNLKFKIENLDKLSDEEVTKELVQVKGIGIWTAKMFLMFTLARPDVFPEEDLGIRNSLKKLLKKDYLNRELGQIASRWKPFRTIASWYLWRSLDNR